MDTRMGWRGMSEANSSINPPFTSWKCCWYQRAFQDCRHVCKSYREEQSCYNCFAMPVMPHHIIHVIAYCFFIVKCLIKNSIDTWPLICARPGKLPRWWTYMIHKHTHTNTHTHVRCQERRKSVQRQSHGQEDASIRSACLRPPRWPTETQGWINGCVQMGKREGETDKGGWVVLEGEMDEPPCCWMPHGADFETQLLVKSERMHVSVCVCQCLHCGALSVLAQPRFPHPGWWSHGRTTTTTTHIHTDTIRRLITESRTLLWLISYGAAESQAKRIRSNQIWLAPGCNPSQKWTETDHWSCSSETEDYFSPDKLLGNQDQIRPA